MTAVPVPKVKITTPDVNSHALAIIKGSKAHAEAWEAIKYMIEDARMPKLTERMPARLDHLEPFVKETVKATPRHRHQAGARGGAQLRPQTAITRHPNQDAILDAINPQLNELWANKIAPGPMLKGLKSQLETLIQKRRRRAATEREDGGRDRDGRPQTPSPGAGGGPARRLRRRRDHARPPGST